MFQQISILGPGLLGASLALAMKRRGLCHRVHTWSRRAETRAQAQQADWCDAVFDEASEACRESQLVIVCTPVETIVPLLKQIAPSIRTGAIVTDVGSTKSLICRQARGISTNFNFIGSHPMAGSEQTGMAHAREDLFEGAACILTPLEDANDDQLASLQKLWQAIGMQVVTSSPEEHDKIVAHISHLPHLLASSLATFLSNGEPEWAQLAGGGLRDTTRVAAGDPNLWRQILIQNSEEIVRAIDGYERELKAFKHALVEKDTASILKTLSSGKQYRDLL